MPAATCGVAITTDGERVVSVRGDADDPFSRGYICPKAAALAGCKVVVPPKRSGLPYRINCGGGAVGTVPGAPGQWRLIWRLSVSHLSGPATGAFIHLASPGQSAAPSFKLCSPCLPVSHGVMALSSTHAATLSTSQEYVDVTTAKNPNGEIRGQITRTLAGFAIGR